jgi:hypothetical protein
MTHRLLFSLLLPIVLLLATAASSRAQTGIPQTRVEAPDDEEDATDIKGAVQDSLRMLMIQHLARIAFQEKTRGQLGGPFFGDYHRSVRIPRQWGDGDAWVANYFGHPVQGAASGFLWLDNTRRTRSFAFNREYWHSRLGATAWATGYSLQFEVGLLSEASIGNVGMNPKTAGWVDHVVTPTGGFVALVGEDVVDRFVISKLENRVRWEIPRAVLRISLNPSRTLANVAALRAPWHRDGRPLKATRPVVPAVGHQ